MRSRDNNYLLLKIVSSGRKHKTVHEWVAEHPDDLEVRMKQTSGSCEVDSLVCKYCACEFDVDKNHPES